jgi:LuxR family maltose regulon positive regulatory protein
MPTSLIPTATVGSAEGGRSPFGDVDAIKLQAPQLRDLTLKRAGLVDRLVRSDDVRLVSIVAAPGYGKSTILALWRAREPRPTAWLTLDARDADPTRLIAGLAAAVERALGAEVTGVVGVEASGLAALSTLVPRLAASLHRAAAPLVLMLDDVHRITGSPSVDALSMLVDFLPPGMTLAVAGRSDAGLPLARFRVGGGLLELAERELAFDGADVIELGRAYGLDPSAAEARDIVAATEGWPAAVYLAVGSRGLSTGDPPAPPRPPSGRDRPIAAYIDAELLARLSPSTRRFLVQTSILERLTGDLCDAVADRRGSGRLLERLVANNQLVVPLEGSYRYHTLLAEHLQGLLEHEPIDRRELHARAAAWFEGQGRPEEAIDHHLSAGRTDDAARLLTGIALPVYRAGQVDTIMSWLDRLPLDELHRHPYLAVFGAWVHVLRGRSVAADRMADVADTGEYRGSRPAGAEAYDSARATLRALMARDGLAAARADAEQALDMEPRSGPWRPIVLAVLGTLLVVVGDPERADLVQREAIDIASEAGAPRAVATTWSGRAMLAIEHGDWLAARDFAREAVAAVERSRLDDDVTVALAAAVAARVALERGASDQGKRLLARFHVARPALGVGTPWLSVRCLLEASKAHLASADPAGARAVLLQADDIVARRPWMADLAAEVEALRTRIRELPPGPGGASTLTPAEIRVLRLLPTYLSVPEIAERLFVTPNTIRTQIQAIYGKLGASSRSEAVELAVAAGLVEPLPILVSGDITSP